MKENTKRTSALLMFLNGKSVNEIAEILTIKPDTLNKWVSRGDWRKLYERNRANAALQYVSVLLNKEIEQKPEEAALISAHLIALETAIANPKELLKAKIEKSLKEIEKVLKDNLI